MDLVRALADWSWALWLSGLVGLVFVFAASRHPTVRLVPAFSLFTAVFAVVAASLVLTVTVIDLDPSKSPLDRFSFDLFPMTVGALWLGGSLFLFRKVDRALYGLAEVAFGACAAGYAAWAPDPEVLSRTLALGAAVYIVVRGLDNIDIGRASGSPSLRFAQRLLTRNSPGQPDRPSENS